MIIRGTRFNVVRPTRLTPAQGGAFAAPVGSPVPPNDADRGVEPHHPTPARVEREEAFVVKGLPVPETVRPPSGAPVMAPTYQNNGIIRLAVTCARQRPGVILDRLDLFARPVVCPPLFHNEDRAMAVSSTTGYTPDEITEFFLMNGPRKLRNLLITECDPRTLENLRVLIRRATPMGESAVFVIYAHCYQSAQDFQMDRVSIPIAGVTIDGFTCVSIITPKADMGHNYNLQAHFA